MAPRKPKPLAPHLTKRAVPGGSAARVPRSAESCDLFTPMAEIVGVGSCTVTLEEYLRRDATRRAAADEG